MKQRNMPSWGWWVVALAVLFVLWARPGRAATYVADGVCATPTGACVAWDVTLPAGWEDNPVLVLRRVWDADQAGEGEATVNGGCPFPLFGGLAAGSHDGAEVPRLSWEVPSACWRAGQNRVAVRWLTNQSPAVHEVRGGLQVELRLPDPASAAGCMVTGSEPPTAEYWYTRVFVTCSDGRGGEAQRSLLLNRAQVEALWRLTVELMQNKPAPPTPLPALEP